MAESDWRCTCGHVYDASVNRGCPSCGSPVREGRPARVEPPSSASGVLVSTTDSIPGYRVVGFMGACASIRTSSGKTATNKAELAWSEAYTQLRESARSRGANAIVGFRGDVASASAGGVFGDSVIATLYGTAVLLEPER